MSTKDTPPLDLVPPPADDEPRDGSRGRFSRRNFLKTVSVTPIAASVIAPAVQAQGAGRVLGPGAVPVEFTLNGKRVSVNVEPRVTLLDAVRTRLNLTGTKRVCDRGSCGACTMIVDGRTVYSCSMLAVEAQGKEVRTVEGLSQSNAALHPVQEAFCDHDATMCGFCTPGFVMSAVALLEKHPNPTREQVKTALDGNICRCGTYRGVIEAALSAKGVSRG